MFKVAGQLTAYAVFALAVGYFSAAPAYTWLPADRGLIKMNFSHAGAPVRECRRFTQAELDQLAPNMRKPMDCPRERVPLVVELEIDGAVQLRRAVPPSGIAQDGAATVYEKFAVAAGTHTVELRMRDSRREQGYDHTFEQTVTIEPGEVKVIDFKSETGGFTLL